MKNLSENNPMMSLIMVIAESLFALIMRLDPELSDITDPLVKDNVVIHLITKYPHTSVYISFTSKGVLFDSQPVDDTDIQVVVIRSSVTQLLQVVMTHDTVKLDKLEVEGNPDHIHLIQTLLLKLGVAHFIQYLLRRQHKTATPPPSPDSDQEQLAVLSQHNTILEQKVDLLTERYQHLKINNAEINNKIRFYKTTTIIASVLLVISVILIFVI